MKKKWAIKIRRIPRVPLPEDAEPLNEETEYFFYKNREDLYLELPALKEKQQAIAISDNEVRLLVPDEKCLQITVEFVIGECETDQKTSACRMLRIEEDVLKTMSS